MHGRRRLIPILLVVVVAASTLWYLNRPAGTSGELTASGTVEATLVTIAPEVAGRVTKVLAEEGRTVTAGQELISLDPSLVAAQRVQAVAAVEVAKAGVAGTEANVAAAQAGVQRADAGIAAAKAAAAAASAAVAGAQAGHSLTAAGSSSEQLALARSQIAQARAAWQGAADVYVSFPSAQRNTPAAVTARAQRDTARAALTTAQAQYSLVAAGSRSQQVAAAAATLDAAQAQLTAAGTQVDAASAQAAAAAAQVDAAKAQLQAANAQEDAATAGLGVVDAQLARLTIASPLAGTVMSRTIEPGEAVTPGATLLQIADLERLTLTVYVPEDRYGAISLGQKVTVTVDSFPGRTFTGQVSRIASQAEFTPRNVSTVDGRKSTVFAIQLSLDPASGLLPGMPADVTFR